MGFFGQRNNYRAKADAELEQAVRKLEKQAEAERASRAAFEQAAAEILSNLGFAQRLNLITEEQAAGYRKRLLQARHSLERVQQESANARGAGTASKARAERCQSMDSYTAQIAEKRAKANKEKSCRQGQEQNELNH